MKFGMLMQNVSLNRADHKNFRISQILFLRWRTAAILKTVKSPYLCNRLTDFDEIWHDDAYWSLTADRPLKFRIFEIQMAAAAILKNHKNRDISVTV